MGDEPCQQRLYPKELVNHRSATRRDASSERDTLTVQRRGTSNLQPSLKGLPKLRVFCTIPITRIAAMRGELKLLLVCYLGCLLLGISGLVWIPCTQHHDAIPPAKPLAPSPGSVALACTSQSARAASSSDAASNESLWLAPGTGGHKFLLFVGPGEQLTKARLHLAEGMALARLLNRTLILPRVGQSFIGPGQPFPLCTYFDVDRIAEYVPWVTVEAFEMWLSNAGNESTPNLPSTYTLYMSESCAESADEVVTKAWTVLWRQELRRLYPVEEAAHNSSDGVLHDNGTRNQPPPVETPPQFQCIPQPRLPVPTLTHCLPGDDQQQERLIEAGKMQSSAEVLVVVKDSFAMYLTSSALKEAAAHLEYAPQIHREAEGIISRHLSPDFVSIHWRMEWLYMYVSGGHNATERTEHTRQQAAVCAHGLVRAVTEAMATAVAQPPAQAPSLSPAVRRSAIAPLPSRKNSSSSSSSSSRGHIHHGIDSLSEKRKPTARRHLSEETGDTASAPDSATGQIESQPDSDSTMTELCTLRGENKADWDISQAGLEAEADRGISSPSHSQPQAEALSSGPSPPQPGPPECSRHVFLASDVSLSKAYTTSWQGDAAYKRGFLHALQALKPVTLAQMEGYDLLDSGQVGIIDKLICMKGRVFLMSTAECGGNSSFSDEIYTRRKRLNMTTRMWTSSVDKGSSLHEPTGSCPIGVPQLV